MGRKEWRSLYQINKPTYFLGLKPVQWVVVSCLLFAIGWLAWWLALLLLLPFYYICRHLSRLHGSGHPDVLTSLVVRWRVKRYFVDHTNIFKRL